MSASHSEPMLPARDEDDRRDKYLSYTLDRTDFSMPSSPEQNIEPKWFWLGVFVATGIGLAMLFELLTLHAGPAKDVTFLVPFFGYSAQLLVGGVWVLANGSWRRGTWTRRATFALLLSSVTSGASQAFDFVALQEAGVMLYTILHSSVTFFAFLISVFLLRTRITRLQWLGCIAVVVGVMLTAVPHSVDARGSFCLGLVCAIAGALCLAAAYPLAELVFRVSDNPPSEEVCSCAGALFNVVAYAVWTLAYTVPRWEEKVVQPINDAKYRTDGGVVALLYMLHAGFVGLHTIAFWKSLRELGTVPTAMSKGAQQAGSFLFGHMIFCSSDQHQCFTNNDGTSTWSRMQKPVSFVVCCLGCLVYGLASRSERHNKVSSTRTVTERDDSVTTEERSTAEESEVVGVPPGIN